MQVFISNERARPSNGYRPIVWDGKDVYVGNKGQSHYNLCDEFGVSRTKSTEPLEGISVQYRPEYNDNIDWDNYREGMVFSDGEIDWPDSSEPEPGADEAILEALGLSDPDFKFGSWNDRMKG